MNTTPEALPPTTAASAATPARAMWLRRTPRWLMLGIAIVALPKCIACVLAYLTAFFALGSAVVEWCGR